MTDLALPEDYATVLAGLKQRVREARFRAQRQVNTELIRLNWQIGQVLAERTDHARWGDKSIQRLSADLRSEFPGSRGFSPRNLLYMRAMTYGPRFPGSAGRTPSPLFSHFSPLGLCQPIDSMWPPIWRTRTPPAKNQYSPAFVGVLQSSAPVDKSYAVPVPALSQ